MVGFANCYVRHTTCSNVRQVRRDFCRAFSYWTGGAISLDDIDTLEAQNDDDKPLTLVPRTELLPSEVGMLSAIEAALRQSTGRIGNGTRLFIFNADGVRACEKGRLSVPYAGETYTWDTSFPGCSQ